MSTATCTSRVAALALLAALAAAPAKAQTLAVVDLGVIPDSRPVVRNLTISNPSARKVVRVDLLSGCPCLTVEPAGLLLNPAGSSVVRVTYTPEGRPGEVSRSLLVKSSLPELDNKRILVGGSLAGGTGAAAPSDCDECRKTEQLFDEQNALADFSNRVLLVDFYGDPGCSQCKDYLDKELPAAARRGDRILRLAEHSILEPPILDQLTRRLDGAGQSLVALPVAFVGDRPYQGLGAIRKALGTALTVRSRPAR